MKRERKKRNKLIVLLVGVLLLMSVGYAAFQTKLDIKGTSKVTSNWDIRITNVSNGTPIGNGENAKTPTFTNLTANMEANLYEKGDAVEYDVTIENKGTFDAKLESIATKGSNNDAIKITFSGYTKGEKLYKNTSQTIKVKVEYNPNFTGTPSSNSNEVNIELNYTQAEGSNVTPTNDYLLTYDYKTNGGTESNASNEYITEGEEVSLTPTAEKKNWIFVGWNTDKNAKEGLSVLNMPSKATTLYAIYKKPLTVTYTKGAGISAIGKTTDSCTLYNLETECEITLPSITVSTGYTVDGWYNGLTKVGTANTKIKLASDITLVSKATINSYTVTYNYSQNGGTAASKTSASVNYVSSIDLTPTATKSGWTFVGWNTNKDATTGLSSLNMSTSNVTLYAIYRKEAKTVTITFNKNNATSQTPSGGSANTGASLTQSCTIAAVYNNATQATTCNITSPTIVGASGFAVVGYNTATSSTTSAWNQATAKAVSSNATYYAVTTKAAVTLTAKFNGNGATLSSTSNLTCTLPAVYNNASQTTSCTVTAPTITRSGYNIIGFNTAASSTANNGSYNTSSKVLTLTTSNNNSTWYPVTSKAVTITFNKNGASTQTNSSGTAVSDATVTRGCTMYNTNTSCNVTSPTIVGASGFAVVGYNTTSGATTSAWNQATAKAVSSNATYYAITKSSSAYTATFNGNGATVASSSLSCYRYNGASSCNVTSPAITRSGFTIVGYNTAAGATTRAWNQSTAKALTGNVTYYAITNKPVIVTFNKGANISAIGAVSGTCTIWNSSTSCAVTLPSITPNTGYTSVGWNTTNGATTGTAASGTLSGLSSNATYYANAVDKTPPTCGITVTNATFSNVTLKATCTDVSGVSKYQLSENGSTYIDKGTTNTYTLASYEISKVRLKATDGASNIGTYQISASDLEAGYRTIHTFLNSEYGKLKTKQESYESQLLNKAHPVGSLLLTTNYSTITQVASALGGTWEVYGKGKTVVGVDSADSNFNTVNKASGSTSNILAVTNLPSHTHSVPTLSGTAASAGAHTHDLRIKGYQAGWYINAAGDKGKNQASGKGKLNFDEAASNLGAWAYTNSTGAHTHSISTNASTSGSNGSGNAFTNLMPYTTVYIYKRVS